jgi:DNA-binding response OmpR family regulator
MTHATQRTILIVENHSPSRELLTRLAVERGVKVLCASTCDEASCLIALAGGEIDGAIMEVNLPDGASTDIEWLECPKLFMSARHYHLTLLRYKQPGALTLAKPFNGPQVMETIEAFFSQVLWGTERAWELAS